MARKNVLDIESLDQQSRALYAALRDERDFASVLLSSSYLDQCLAALLSRYFLDTAVSGKMLDPRGGALGTYAARCDLAYCLGLVAKVFYQNLALVGVIRNRMAHTHLEVDFEDEEVARWCLELEVPPFIPCEVGPDGQPPDLSICTVPRERFTIVVTLMVNRLVLTAMEETHRVSKEAWWS